jgi:putative ABC transport system substrate-binding protein
MRRDFIALVGGAAVLWSQAASAQNPGAVRPIGVLLSLAESAPEAKAQLSGFIQGLAKLEWIEGRTLQTEVRWGSGDVDRIRSFAKELVALQPDVIVAHGTPVTAALHRETRTIPIVFVTVSDPVGDGFVAPDSCHRNPQLPQKCLSCSLRSHLA